MNDGTKGVDYSEGQGRNTMIASHGNFVEDTRAAGMRLWCWCGRHDWAIKGRAESAAETSISQELAAQAAIGSLIKSATHDQLRLSSALPYRDSSVVAR